MVASKAVASDGSALQLTLAPHTLRRVDEEEVAGDDMNACTPLLKLSPEAAREEYLLNGQEGLDDLLAALDGGFEVRRAGGWPGGRAGAHLVT